MKDEAVIAKVYSDSMLQVTAALENFMKSLEVKKQELEVCNPFLNQRRKELIEEIARTEMEIQSLYDRRDIFSKHTKQNLPTQFF